MINKDKAVIWMLRYAQDYCEAHACGECAIKECCKENFHNLVPRNWYLDMLTTDEYGEPIVYIKRLAGGRLPEKKSKGAAAWDCYAREGAKVFNGEKYKIPLGFALAMPNGVHATLIPRSSIGLKTDLIMANGQGLIDSDYRGEACAIYRAINLDWDTPSYLPDSDLHEGDRIAQIYFNKPVVLVEVNEFCDEVKDTERGEGGFGSTGK